MPCRLKFVCLVLSFGVLFLSPLGFAQSDFPMKPIQVVVPYPGGGTSTLVMNVIGEKMGEILGKPVVVVNKPGGGSAVGAVFAANAKPDGYTLLLTGGAFLSLPLTMKSEPYKVSDLTPVGRMTTGDFILAVHKDVPVNTLNEFITYARKNPGKLSYAAGSSGSLPRLGSELLKDRAKIDAQYIPFPSPSQSVPALLGGHVQFGVMEAFPAIPHIRSKSIKPLAIFSTKRDPHLPDVPTFIEEGYPDVITYTFFLLLAPAKTPVPIVKKLESALKGALQDKNVQEKLVKVDSRADFLSAEETRTFMENETRKWSDIIKKTKIDFKE